MPAGEDAGPADWWSAEHELLSAPKRNAGLGINYNRSAKQVRCNLSVVCAGFMLYGGLRMMYSIDAWILWQIAVLVGWRALEDLLHPDHRHTQKASQLL
jgi:hypothetical protein